MGKYYHYLQPLEHVCKHVLWHHIKCIDTCMWKSDCIRLSNSSKVSRYPRGKSKNGQKARGQRIIFKTTQKTKDWATWTPLNREWIQVLRKWFIICCSTDDVRHITVKQHEHHLIWIGLVITAHCQLFLGSFLQYYRNYCW